MVMLWWHWVVLGLVLAGFELLTPGGFFVMFFGVGAVLVGLLSLLGLGGPLWLQWLLFSILSVASLLALRQPLARRLRLSASTHPVDSLEGQLALPLEEIAPGAVGRVELRGSAWSARNAGPTPLTRGQRCVVERVDGLTVSIRAEEAIDTWSY